MSHPEDGTLAEIDLASNTFRNLVSDEWIITMVVSPDGETIYGSSRTGDSISVIDVASETASDHVFVGFPSIGTALHANGSTLFSTHPDGDLVAVIDTATATLIDTIDVSEHDVVSGIAVHPAGTILYINSGQRPPSADPGSVTVIALDTLIDVDTIMVGSNPNSIGHYLTPMGLGGAITEVGTRQVTCEPDHGPPHPPPPQWRYVAGLQRGGLGGEPGSFHSDDTPGARATAHCWSQAASRPMRMSRACAAKRRRRPSSLC